MEVPSFARQAKRRIGGSNMKWENVYLTVWALINGGALIWFFGITAKNAIPSDACYLGSGGPGAFCSDYPAIYKAAFAVAILSLLIALWAIHKKRNDH